ncbi:hypothetical protein BJX68DRAFT_269789 [Aspergillus pseudodeflectus]|uniref:Uncharacterized protein n=1 Tax=Aspergillus pseudodeflectus TaxID=176178 RepID=A0ABR4JW57_9EURO
MADDASSKGMIILGATVGVLLGSLLTILGLFVRPCFKKRKPERMPCKLTDTGCELTGDLISLAEAQENGRLDKAMDALIYAEQRWKNCPSAPSSTTPSASASSTTPTPPSSSSHLPLPNVPTAAPPAASWFWHPWRTLGKKKALFIKVLNNSGRTGGSLPCGA